MTAESWIAKAKQAGLPPDERALLEQNIKNTYTEKDRIGAENISYLMEKSGLPTQGIESIELSEELARPFHKKAAAAEYGMDKLQSRVQRLIDTEGYIKKQSEIQHLDKAMYRLQNKQEAAIEKAEQIEPRWYQYSLDEVTSHREILYKQRGSTYKNPDIETHYPGELGEGLVWHQREGKLKFPEGESTHLTEQQSDLISEWVKHGNKQDKNVYIWEGMAGEEYTTPLRNIEIRRLDDESFGIVERSTGREFETFPTRRMAEQHIEQSSGEANVPKPPLEKDWYKTGFKDLVNRAVREDSKFISWDSAAVQKKRWPAGEGTDKFFDSHYDQKLVNFVKKEYGVTPEKINLGKKSGFSDPQTGESISADKITIKEYRYESGEPYYEVVANPGAGQPFVNLGIREFDTREAAQLFIDAAAKAGGGVDEVWRIPVTEEMKRKVLLEGQYFSKKDDFSRPYDIG